MFPVLAEVIRGCCYWVGFHKLRQNSQTRQRQSGPQSTAALVLWANPGHHPGQWHREWFPLLFAWGCITSLSHRSQETEENLIFRLPRANEQERNEHLFLWTFSDIFYTTNAKWRTLPLPSPTSSTFMKDFVCKEALGRWTWVAEPAKGK